MCQAFQEHCDGSFVSILFAFSAIKGPAKELRLSFMSGEKYVNKTNRELSVKMTPAQDFFKFNAPSRLDFQGL